MRGSVAAHNIGIANYVTDPSRHHRSSMTSRISRSCVVILIADEFVQSAASNGADVGGFITFSTFESLMERKRKNDWFLN